MTKLPFKKAIALFDDTRILVIGDLMLDHYIRGSAARISPEAPVPVVEFAGESYSLGGAGNTAVNVNELKAKTIITGFIGNDVHGEIVMNLLKKKGIDAGGIIMVDDRRTTIKTRVIAEQQQLIRIDREIRDEIDEEYTIQILDFINSKLEATDAIIISDYDKGTITAQLIEGLIPVARKLNKPIIVDPKFRHILDYRGVTSIKPNLAEASAATGIGTKDEASVRKMGHSLLAKLGCETVLITRGKDGMSLFSDNKDTHIMPSIIKHVYDVAGAGDTVASVFTLGLASGLSAENAAVLANLAAGVVVEKLGVATVTKAELEQRLEILEKNGFY